ncbi:uncharacterized protein EV420DRAFT_1281601, partial [Desarmillaria tabescens]
LDKLKLKQRMLSHDMATRWSSTYDMLAMALEYKKAVKQITSDDEEIGDRVVPEFRLSLKEWKMLPPSQLPVTF